MIQPNITQYFCLIAACLLANCQQYHRMEIGTRLTQQTPQNPSCSTTEQRPEATRPPLPKFVLVLLHGFTMDASENDKIKAAAEEAFGKYILIIQPKCREGSKSSYLSIEAQGKQVAIEIQTILRDRYPEYTKEELKALQISIFGYSQGGLVGCMLAANHSNDLNITAIVTAHTPLYGVDALDNTVSDVKKFTTKAKPGLAAIGHPDISQVNMNIAAWLLNGRCINKLTKSLFKGLSDMRRDATCIARIKKFIRENKNDTGSHNIPILLIGGYLSNLAECFDYAKEHENKVQKLNKSYALLTTKQKYGLHDILISLKSQLCRGDSFDNLTSPGDDSVYAHNVATYVSKDQLHCWNLILILSNYRAHYGKTLFQNKEAIACITEFLGKHNNLSIQK